MSGQRLLAVISAGAAVLASLAGRGPGLAGSGAYLGTV